MRMEILHAHFTVHHTTPLRGIVQKCCDGLPDDMPFENVQMMMSMKQVPLKIYGAVELEDSLWVTKN